MIKPTKKDIITLLVSLAVSLASVLLLIFSVRAKIPLLFDINESITYLGSKYFILPLAILPLIFSIIFMCMKKNSIEKDMIFILIFLLIYENFITLTYLLVGTSFDAGSKIEIPLSCFIFFPLSLLLLSFGAKIKNLPYKSTLGIKNKYTTEVEFIWIQTHFFASRVLMMTGLILTFISLIFSFFHLGIVMLAIFIVAIIVAFAVIYSDSKKMYKKYSEMKAKQDKLNSKKQASN